MKKLNLIMVTIAVALFATASISAADTGKTAQAAPEMKNQTHCPVMGGKIDSTVYTDIQGQRVYHCCPMCSGKLKADPDKYFEEAAAKGVVFENTQFACPVSYEPLKNKEKQVNYKGRQVFFCCNDCVEKFNKDPQKYLQRLEEVSGDPDADKTEMEEDHQGQGHDHDHMDHDMNDGDNQ